MPVPVPMTVPVVVWFALLAVGKGRAMFAVDDDDIFEIVRKQQQKKVRKWT